MTILKNLNPKQVDAAIHSNGPLLILAGAGSGKTRVLIYRIAHLVLEKGVPARNILAVTFTNKAAGEMRERPEKLLGPRAHDLWLGTFHSIGLRILRRDGHIMGILPGFTVYDDDDQLSLVKRCMTELEISDRRLKPRVMLSQINQAKNKVVDPQQYAEQASDFFSKRVARVYDLYQRRLRDNTALDFGDLICEPIRLFRENPSLLDKYQVRFQHMLVDEYQDTNRAQYYFISFFAKRYRNLCVVGDPDQSIYCWRGADITNILAFEKDYPDAAIYRLEQNYRSTGNILSAANSVIRNNRRRIEKSLWTENPEGERVAFEMARDEHHETELVAKRILEMIPEEPSRSYRDFAIFYRTNAQSRVMEEYFIRNGIPYTIVGGFRFYERKEIKDAIAYIRVVANPHDSLSLLRIINTPPRGVGRATLDRVSAVAGELGLSMYEAFKEASQRGILSRAKVTLLLELMDGLHRNIDSMLPHELCHTLLTESGYIRMWEEEGTDEAESRVENLHELISAIRDFETARENPTLVDFLDQVALISDIDSYEDRHNRVTLMTLHSAKGLEFPVVFMTGMEEGLFPHARSIDDAEEIEEERRLCYVGMTRAMERLFLFSARQRTLFGEPRFQAQSRFIDEIDPEFLNIQNDLLPAFTDEIEDSTCKEPYYTMEESQVEDMQNNQSGWYAGMQVRHPTFGVGVIKACEGFGEMAKLTITFDAFGRKKLIAKYASLIPVVR
ncbi:MAG: UvrD-helicase domain-containing protein [Thermodesulfobacteriota bacterium]